MAAKTTGTGEFANSLLKLIFNGTAFANMADNAATSPFVNLYASLHTASPTATGNQSSQEASFPGYMRTAVARNSGGWIVTANSVSPASAITFATATGGSDVITHFGIGTSSTGNGHLLWFGPVTPQVVITTSAQVQLSASSIVTEV